MSEPRSLDAAIVTLICDIDSRLLRNERSQEVNEYRRGYQEALTGLKNDVPMIDVIDALKAAGWQPPRRQWVQPPPAEMAARDDAEQPTPTCSNCGMRHAPDDTAACIEGHGDDAEQPTTGEA